ncbi:DUF362 domain-containing protein [bacterium]|jgi:uncharacterized protein (DUF362 family)|nr:DUF362 domain-containing protein [bacterium]
MKSGRDEMERRDFLKTSVGIVGTCSLLSTIPHIYSQSQNPDLVVVNNGDPENLVKRAIQELGGMSHFVNKGDIVVIKPNISWDRLPEQAANTNPEIVAEVVKLCLDAGAKKVKIFDNSLNEPRRCYDRSGIEKAAKEAGAEVYHVQESRFKKVNIEEGKLIKSWELYQDVLEADRVINLPIAKHHTISGLSLSMKNVMGFIGGNRGLIHRQFDIKITDLNTKIKSDLIILDAYRMLLRNGPSGGNLTDVELKKTVIMGTNPVSIDSFGATLFHLQPEKIGFLQEAYNRGLGEIDLKKLNIKMVSLEV